MIHARLFLGTAGLCALTSPVAHGDETVWKKAAALKPGDLVALVAPASPFDAARVKAYAKRLEAAGYKVRMTPRVGIHGAGYLAGTDDERAGELNAAFRDPAVRAVVAARGGYGLTRLLDKLDYAALRADPKIVVGFSDLTALHLAVAAKAK
ncbi:MAG: LD-carboxypeptidase, partial [Planctomycetia bacterium]